jgi:hypothetical protein
LHASHKIRVPPHGIGGIKAHSHFLSEIGLSKIFFLLK